MALRRRILLYSQHLSGTGHYIRTFEIACALAEHHDVYLVEGGRPVPRCDPAHAIPRVMLPKICRGDVGIVSLEPGQSLAECMARRRHELLQAVATIRPDFVVVEHFPFSKSELNCEIIATVEHARKMNQHVKVICSVRDILSPTRHDPAGDQHRDFVVRTLGCHFDYLLVHADPRLSRLQDSISWSADIPVPIEYTGFVARPLSPHKNKWQFVQPSALGRQPAVVVSVGGAGQHALISHACAAWKQLDGHALREDRALIVFLPLYTRSRELQDAIDESNADAVRFYSFMPEFREWLQVAELSISHAGYNTCADLLQTRTKAILVPDSRMSDQAARAERLARRGLMHALNLADLTIDQLADVILDRLACPDRAPPHDINLDGARITRRILEQL